MSQFGKPPQNSMGENDDNEGHQVVQTQSPLLRVNADNQQPIRFWFLWIGLFVVMLLIILLVFALPPVFYDLTNHAAFGQHGIDCGNPTGFDSDNNLYCNDYSSGNPVAGLVARQLSNLNQFGFLYLELKPKGGVDLLDPIMNQKATMQVYTIFPSFKSEQEFNFKRGQLIYDEKVDLKINGQDEDEDDYDDRRRILIPRMLDDHDHDDDDEYGRIQYLLGVIREMEGQKTDYFVRLQFSQPVQLEPMESVQLKGYTLTEEFTNFTIAIRYVYFFVSLITGIMFLRRFFQIPREERILQVKFIAIASILLWLFNDPFYPITILKPNAASAFFSVFFVSFYLIMVLLLWVFFLRRIRYEQGDKHTELLSFRRSWAILIFAFILYVLMLVIFMSYSLQAVKYPLIREYEQDNDGLIAVIVIVVIMLIVLGLYIIINFLIIVCKHCQNPGVIMWRHMQFLKMLPAFVILFLASTIGLGFTPYSYSAEWILYGYSFLNIHMYLLQYLYYTPKEELQQRERNVEVFSDHFTLKSDISYEGQTQD